MSNSDRYVMIKDGRRGAKAPYVSVLLLFFSWSRIMLIFTGNKIAHLMNVVQQKKYYTTVYQYD